MAETYRPQFHFTARTGWLNDPNGLVCYAGEYHLFFQHNPHGTNWGNMTWGHAVSPDLVHWRQLDHALAPDALGTIFSGSAVVDWQGTAGFGREALIALYTAAGETVSPKAPTTQCLAASTDRGRTWQKYAGNPVLPQLTPGNRDPRVFWHAPTGRWIMALYVGTTAGHTVQFFAAADLKHWTHLSTLPGFYECPDLFPLGDQWVLFGADGHYLLGQFDGTTFTPTSGLLVGDWGPNYYAAQTFSDIPATDGRRILVAWMRGGRYPDMPFNQQMTFPCELTLHAGRLRKWPVRELASLYAASHDCLAESGELCDISAEIAPGHAWACGFTVRGCTVTWLAGEQCLCLGQHRAPLPLRDGRLRLRLLVDRTSLEVFGHDGEVAFSACSLPHPQEPPIAFFSHGGQARLTGLAVHDLRPAPPA
jgi:sucrose-6-phosphate hydrolase SacC (GH32 family)